jgi:ribosomal protein S6E (S10)
MTEPKAQDDDLLKETETAVRKLLKSKVKSERLSAIGHSVKLLAIKYKINGGDEKAGFFDK